eukprot:TRINITY_DN2094_c1_g2_i1.p1 TRINITY_DN2094_c1_g2~~TRINITY_DN2094_c1_g2_i1.p1  ORF type:complete len:200 (+),score=23.42 TRINITY_DN2094_c1_g2_i1:65-664(+)
MLKRLVARGKRSVYSGPTTGIPGAFLGRFPALSVEVGNPVEFVRGVPYLEEGFGVQEAAKFLQKLDVGAVPVLCPVEGGGEATGALNAERVVTGMFSERDIARAFATHGSQLGELKVSDLMSRNVISCSKQDSLKKILDTMLERNFRHLPCVDSRGRLIGLVSMRDAVWSRAQAEGPETDSTIRGVDDFLSCITEATRV